MTEAEKIAVLELKLKLVMDALEFYAHGKSWESNYYSGNNSKIQHDQGKRAVEALKEAKK